MKISAERFRQLMVDPGVSERELRAYLTVDLARSHPFNPAVIPDPAKVEVSAAEIELESAMGIGNGFSRWRRRQIFKRRQSQGESSPILVAEGDSWFQFPFLIEDVIDHLGRDHLIWCASAAGDTAHNMVFTQPEYLEALDQQAEHVRAFLLSAAGNDVIGEDTAGRPMLANLVKQAQGDELPAELIDRDALTATMNALRKAYREVVTRVRADARFEKLPIVIHGYDYCFPGTPDDPRKPLYAAPDHWLGRALRARGVAGAEAQRAIVRILIDELYGMLFSVAEDDEAGAVHVVDARGAMPAVSDWADEIHGTDDGFAKVAERFRETLDIAIGRDQRSQFRRFRGVEHARTSASRFATIVVDPGHGGTKEIGGSSPNNSTGPGGTKEKDMTLAVGLLLRDELMQRGHRVLMTRATDRNLSLADRAAVARDQLADVFLSIHFNGWHSPTVQGTETLRHESSNGASELLARRVQEAVCGATGRRDRGVKTASLGVLRPSRHAAGSACCLSEVSFLTDPTEEARLADESYRSRIATAMADGIELYLAEAGRAQPGSFEMLPPAFTEDQEAIEHEDAAQLAAPAKAVTAVREMRVALSRPIKAAARLGDPTEHQVRGISDAARFLRAWRDHRRVPRGLETSRFERQIGTDDTLPTWFLRRGAEVAAAVCKIEASGVAFDGVPGTWVGTGFLVAPHLLLTNNHVLHDIQTARGAIAVFSHEVGEDGRFAPRRTYTLDPDRLFLTSPAEGGLDFTFVHIDGDAHEAFGTIPINRGSFVIAPGERANLLHHPGGKPKCVSLRANKSIDFDTIFLHYVSDTESGSSGAPVLDDTWRLIALHHAWDNVPDHVRLPEDFPTTFLNEGVKLSAITVDLESRLATAEAAHARRVLDVIRGSDSLTGYFGVVGRRPVNTELEPRQRVEAVYRGGAQDVDIAYWNAAWFAEKPHERAGATATMLVDLNLDIWALSHCPPEAAQILRDKLRLQYGQEFAMHASPLHGVSIFWNPMTVEGREVGWAEQPGAPAPLLYRFSGRPLRSEQRLADYEFCLVPVAEDPQLPANERRASADHLAAAISAPPQSVKDLDWVIAGPHAPGPIVTTVQSAGVLAAGAEDPNEGAIVVVKRSGSLVDELFVPPSMTHMLGSQDYVRFARDAESAELVRKMTGRRPLMMRLSLLDSAPRQTPQRPMPKHAPQPAPALPDSPEARERLIRDFLQWLAQHHTSDHDAEDGS